MIRVLQSVSYMHRAGLETMLMNYYRNVDRTKVQFDFLINKNIKGEYEDEIISLGGRIFRTPGYNPLKYFKYKKYMKELFISHPEISIVHAHNDFGYVPLMCAKKAGIKTRVFHSHSTSLEKNFKYPVKLFCKKNIRKAANYLFGCGEQALRYYYGDKAYENGLCTEVKNAIDAEKFIFSEDKKNRARNELCIPADALVVGIVGRFVELKNHAFLLDVFKILCETNPNSVLIMAGDGELADEVKEKAKILGIYDKCIFTGSVADTQNLYAAMDVYVMCSVYEGVTLAGIEAQAAGLPCVFSSGMSKETAITKNVVFADLKDGAEAWAKQILKAAENKPYDTLFEVTEAGFNIKTEAKKLEAFYLEHGGNF